MLDAALSPGASVLQLGAGTGRISGPLARLGHPTTALDHSGEMLRFVTDAEPVRADIRSCDLGRTFDAVILATFLINVPDPLMRADFLRVGRRHLAPTGQVLVQRQIPERFAQAGTRIDAWDDGGERETTAAHFDGELLTLSEVFRIGGQEWQHTFTARLIPDDQLPEILAEAGLVLDRWLSRQWFVARPS